MNHCPGIESLINLNCGRLGDEVASEVSRHLDHCEECLSTISSLQSSTAPALRLAAGGCAPGFEFSHENGLAVSRASVPLPDRLHEPVENWKAPREFRDYVLLGQIGRGGMGTVYRARHVQLERIVAIKFLSEDHVKDAQAVARFQREMRAVGRLEHPNIVRATDAGVLDGGIYFIAMEFVDGPDISDLLRSAKTLPVADACEIAAQTALALDHASRRGLVHRDVKPSNIMISIPDGDYSTGQSVVPEPVVRVLDFGLARIDSEVAHSSSDTVNRRDASTELTAAGQIMGTPDYIAPEQIGSSHEVDIRADVYSLGATLFKMVTGEFINQWDSVGKLPDRPGPNEEDIVAAVTGRLDQPLARLILRMVARSPEDRFQSPGEVLDALAPFRAGANLSQLVQRHWCRAFAAEQKSESPTIFRVTRCLDLTVGGSATTDRRDRPGVQQREDASGGVSTPTFRDRLWARTARFWWMMLAASGLTAIAFGLSTKTQTTTVRLEVLGEDIAVEVIGTEIRLSGPQSKEVSIIEGQYPLLVSCGAIRFQTRPFNVSGFGSEIVQVGVTDGFLEARDSRQLLGRAEISAKKESERVDSVSDTTSELAELIWSRDPDAPLPANAPFNELQARDYQKAWAEHIGIDARFVVELSPEVSMTLLVIPPGEFMMGSTREQIEQIRSQLPDTKGRPGITLRSRNLFSEMPQHRVLLSRPWLMGETEVTVNQFQQYIIDTGNDLNPEAENLLRTAPGNSAMEHVTWEEATEFCHWLSKKCGRSFRLPTEAEWEFACRAGTTTEYSFGDDPSQLPLYADTSLSSHRPDVGQALPNAFGLRDMHGSLNEWCQDQYGHLWYQMSTEIDPAGPEWGDQLLDLRVCRGGKGHYSEISSRSATRKEVDPRHTGPLVGFRVAMSIEN
jgi:serine/threonine protein kinase/formylglycine-generating enzyme required for sulfatase activity